MDGYLVWSSLIGLLVSFGSGFLVGRMCEKADAKAFPRVCDDCGAKCRVERTPHFEFFVCTHCEKEVW